MMRKLFQRLPLAALPILMGYSISFSQTSTTQRVKNISISRFEHMTPQEKIEYAKVLLQKNDLAKHGIPEIVISEKQPFGRIYGEYNGSGESQLYKQPTIVLFPLAFKSDGQFEVALRHEMMHYWAEKNGPPVTLKSIWASLKQEILKRFDFSDIPESLKEGVISGLIKGAQRASEELYISDELLKIASTLEDAKNAIAAAKQTQEAYKADYESFYSHSETFFAGGKEYKIRPKKQEESDATAPDISGEYECLDCPGPYNHSGTFVQDATAYSPKTTITISPLMINQIGDMVTLRQTMTMQTAAFSNETYTQNASQSSTVSEGNGKIINGVATIEWRSANEGTGGEFAYSEKLNQMARKSQEDARRLLGTETPNMVEDIEKQIRNARNSMPRQTITTQRSTLKILDNGDIQMSSTLPDGKTYTFTYQRK